MKIRNGFVSNSSSSSFVCDVCSTVESGYDGQYDFPTTYCRGGHHFCSEHLDDYLEKLSLEDKVKIALEYKYFAETLKDEEVAIVKKGNTFAMEDVFERFMNSWDDMPESICPICSLSDIPDWAIIKYLLKECNKTQSEIEAELKSKFNTLKELKEGLK